MEKKIHQRAHDMLTNAHDTPKRNIPEELKALLEWDKKITKVAFDAFDKRFGYQKYRTQMKWLENSCHGIPWLVTSVAMLYLGAWPGGLELWMNLLIYLISISIRLKWLSISVIMCFLRAYNFFLL